MKHVCSLIVTCILFFPLAFSQITFQASDILNLLGTRSTLQGSFENQEGIGPGMAGMNQSWNLDTISTDTSISMVWTFESPKNTPYADSFPEANFVQILSLGDSSFSSIDYDYVKVTETAYINIGDVSISTFGGLIDTTFRYENDTVVFLPLTYESSWELSSIDSSEFFETTEVSMDTSTYLVDAYGSVTVSTGTFDCLRLRTTDRSTSYTFQNGVAIDTTESVEVLYIWLAKEVFFAAQMAGPEASADPNFSTVSTFLRLTDFEQVPMDTTNTDTTGTDSTGTDSLSTPLRPLLELVEEVQLSPNPAKEAITLSFSLPEKMPMEVSIYDLRGRRVHTLVNGSLGAGPHSYTWQGKTQGGKLIEPGWYLAVMRSGERGHSMKFSLATLGK